MPPPRPASIKVRALQWLAQREHSRTELQAKLMRVLGTQAKARTANSQGAEAEAADQSDAHAGAVAEVEQLLDWLCSHGYLSTERFVESRVHARQGRFGNLRIQQELRRHGLALPAPAQEELRATELSRAQEVWRKKYGQPAVDAAGRARQGRFLIGRGFSGEVVRKLLRGETGDPDE